VGGLFEGVVIEGDFQRGETIVTKRARSVAPGLAALTTTKLITVSHTFPLNQQELKASFGPLLLGLDSGREEGEKQKTLRQSARRESQKFFLGNSTAL
jgi:hypothetical protein